MKIDTRVPIYYVYICIYILCTKYDAKGIRNLLLRRDLYDREYHVGNYQRANVSTKRATVHVLKFRYQGVDEKRGEEERHRHDQSDGEYYREFHVLLVLRIETEDHVEQFGVDDAETVILSENGTLVFHVDRTVIEKHKRIARILVRGEFIPLMIDARIPDEQVKIASRIRRCVDQR